jgi:intracellular septation protein A
LILSVDSWPVPTTIDEPVLLEPTSIGAVIRRAGPRLVRDGFGPLAIFFAGWKLIGLTAGIGMAALFGVSVFIHERRQGRPAMIVRLALILVAIRASVGLSSDSATVYLAQEIGIDTLLGCTVLASLAFGRPFASWFAGEIFPLPQEMRESDTFQRAMRTITAVWGLYFLARAMVRLAALLTLSTDSYALVIALSDAPFLIAILAWSIYHTASAFRNSARWAPVIAAAETSQARSESLPG